MEIIIYKDKLEKVNNSLIEKLFKTRMNYYIIKYSSNLEVTAFVKTQYYWMKINPFIFRGKGVHFQYRLIFPNSISFPIATTPT